MSDPRVRVKWDGPRISALAEAAAKRALFLAAEEILHQANANVPLDTGILQSSGETHVSGQPAPANGPLSGTDSAGRTKVVDRPPLTSVSTLELTSAVFFNTPYARYLHESHGLDFQGSRTDHWLESAVQEHGPRVIEWAKAEFKKKGF